VPAWLHGLDWASDPAASVPCAQRQLTNISRLVRAADLSFDAASVGDPDLWRRSATRSQTGRPSNSCSALERAHWPSLTPLTWLTAPDG
jgi:hypothetical protein